ncbi:SPOR domain-containing protein [Carboxylicivirga taeanensis]|uniref:SPOR domain-containing protein n=1 Tax=Carboxylicivirga taeanensis TaxID=1416875 RepID=UPI003F6DD30E
MRKLITAFAILALLIVGCKDKTAKTPQKPVKTAVVEKQVVADSLNNETPEPVVEEVQPEPPKPADKYFLIAGSFASRHNADEFVTQLTNEGYNAQVIERPAGPNSDFYKVSYMSFYDRNEAFAELRNARDIEGRDDVWLLIKK